MSFRTASKRADCTSWRARCPSLLRPCPEVVDLSHMYQLAEASPTAPVPPQNLDAEESVLGAMMLSPGAIGAVSEVLSASDFYRASHGSIYKAALDLYAKGEPVDAITLCRRARAARRAGGDRRPHPHQRAGRTRADAVQRRPLRARSSARWRRSVAWCEPGRRSRGSGWSARGSTAEELVDKAESVDLRPLAGARRRRVHPHRGPAQGQLRAHHRPVRGGRRRHRHRQRLPRARPADVRLPARQPDRRGRPPEHGQVGVRPLRGREPRRSAEHAGGAVHARDVEDGGDAAPHVLRGEGRVAAPPHRQARARRTGRA